MRSDGRSCAPTDKDWLSPAPAASLQMPSAMTFLRIVIPLYLFDLSMISAQTRSAFVARENRYPLFRIMLQLPSWQFARRRAPVAQRDQYHSSEVMHLHLLVKEGRAG
jgi:hypothetical protein